MRAVAYKQEPVSTDTELSTLLCAISGLSVECKRVLTLRKVYGWKQDRIAEHLGVEGRVVENHLRACVRSLAKLNGH